MVSADSAAEANGNAAASATTRGRSVFIEVSFVGTGM
jgi:hypothetical protein